MLSNIIEIIILSLIQGISEFLPISSSAHLIVVSTLYEFKSSSLLIDISLHLGSMLAIIFFFKNELLDIKNNQKLLLLMIFGSVPLIIVGYILYKTELIYFLRDIKIILYIGLFQTLALIPGVSRAGISMTASRFFRFNRFDSSKISFLLAIPALAGASVLGLKDVVGKSFELNYLVFIAITLSFLSSYFTVKFFLKYINKFSLNIFVIYRIVVAIILFVIIYS